MNSVRNRAQGLWIAAVKACAMKVISHISILNDLEEFSSKCQSFFKSFFTIMVPLLNNYL